MSKPQTALVRTGSAVDATCSCRGRCCPQIRADPTTCPHSHEGTDKRPIVVPRLLLVEPKEVGLNRSRRDRELDVAAQLSLRELQRGLQAHQ
jgi:hypothetical protein